MDEIPAYNWMQLNEAFDYNYLLKSPIKLNGIKKRFLLEKYKIISREYIDRFGLSMEFILVMEKKKEIALNKIELFVTGDESIKTLIEIGEIELDKLTKGPQKKVSFMEFKSYIEKHFGFRLDLKTVTAGEFYTYLEIIKRNGR